MDPWRTRSGAPPNAGRLLGEWYATNVAASLANGSSGVVYLGSVGSGYYDIAVPYDCDIVGVVFAMRSGTGTTGTLTITPWKNGADPGASYDMVFQNQSNGAATEGFFIPIGAPLPMLAGDGVTPGDVVRLALTTPAGWDSTGADFVFQLVVKYKR